MREKSVSINSRSFHQFFQSLEIQRHKRPSVKTVLIILSAEGLGYDVASLTQFVSRAYSQAAVFFMTSSGKPFGFEAPSRVDLGIDFTSPQDQVCGCQVWKWKKKAAFLVGRSFGWVRPWLYDRVLSCFEKRFLKDFQDPFQKILFLQAAVLALAGISTAPMSAPTENLSASIAEDLESYAQKAF